MMNNLINYFVEANLCLLIFGAFYLIFLRRESHFRLSRFSLLGIVFASLFIPVFHFTNPFAGEMSMPAMNDFYALIPEELYGTPVEAAGGVVVSNTIWTVPVILSLSYAAVILILLTIFITQVVQLFKFRITTKNVEKGEDCIIIPTNGQWPTFSFFKMLFFDNSKALSAEEKQKILDHELVHIRQRHSLDIVLIELVKIIFWINPVIWMLRGSMEEVHEYLADEKVLKSTDKKYYSSLLAKVALNRMSLNVGLHFNKSIILKRIEMMKTPKQKIKMWKWSGMFSIIMLIGIVFSCNDEVMNDVTEVMQTASQVEMPKSLEGMLQKLQEKYPEADFIYMEAEGANVEAMKNLKGVDPKSIAFFEFFKDRDVIGMILNKNGPIQQISEMARKDEVFQIVEDPAKPIDGYDSFYKDVAQKLEYPAEAKEKGHEGTVYVQFVVDTDGSITEVQPIRGIGFGCDQAAVNAIASSEKWKPAYQRGKAVKQRIVLPIKFSLGNSEEEDVLIETEPVAKDIFIKVDDPATPVGDYKAFYEHIGRNIEYPAEARKQGIEGTVYVQFIVDTDGTLTKLQVLKGIGAGCDEEAIRVISISEKWKPAHQKEKIVKQRIVLPIKFSLNNKAEGNSNIDNGKQIKKGPDEIEEVVVVGYQ